MTILSHSTVARLPVFAGLIAIGIVVLLCQGALCDDWPRPAERSGVFLPPPRQVAISASINGAYVPKIARMAADESGILEGTAAWNFAFGHHFGLVGRHTLSTMWWAGDKLLSMYHEFGARIKTTDLLTLETAWLHHRAHAIWVDDMKIYPGGALDNGAETGVWFHLAPIDTIHLDFHVFGRAFSVYTETHLVAGSGLRISLQPMPGHALVLEVEMLEVWRREARASVDGFTHNTMGQIFWRSRLKNSLGLQLGVKFSANLLVGETPMLELRRSMIGEPMLLGTAGLFFSI